MLLGNLLIGLREGLEAALVVSILIAYVTRTGRRHLLGRIWAGVVIAALISLGFGALLTFGPKGLTFQAQEAIGGSLSLVAVGLITWMILWMAKASKSMSSDLRTKVDQTAEGNWWQLTMVGALAVGREGLETALFLWANTRASGNDFSWLPTIGALLGIAAAIVIAALLYGGIVRIDLGKFFRYTGLFLVLVAAGVFSYGISDLQEAGILPGQGVGPYDISGTFGATGFFGTLLKAIFQFTPNPTWLQFWGWIAYVVIVMPLFLWVNRPRPAGTRTGATNRPTDGHTSPATDTTPIPADAAPVASDAPAPATPQHSLTN